MAVELHWTQYVTRAFTWQWNLLLLGGATVAALISGHADIALPLVLAAEGTYIAAMSANRKFRKSVDVAHHKALHVAQAEEKKANRLRDMLQSLTHDRRDRFIQLRERCSSMAHIAARVRGEMGTSPMHAQSLDKMLWTFLRLLASDQALSRFASSTDTVSVQRRVKDLEAQIATAKRKSEGDKIVRALVDSLATAKLRLDNLSRAEENSRFVAIELDRVEDKIQALVEMAVGHEDPDFISGQVDDVAASLDITEAAMRDMSVPGVEYDDEAPQILTEAAY
jgi:hypothetical protein